MGRESAARSRGPGVSVPDEPGPLVARRATRIHSRAFAEPGECGCVAPQRPLVPWRPSRFTLRSRALIGPYSSGQELFEGVRQGQPIGALLGYTFERNLHEAKLDDLIDVFRKIAAFARRENRRIVVDGLALAAKWTADKNSVLPASDPRRAKAEKVLNALEVAVDAAADAVHAEGAFQMVRGNFARAAASLDAISSGQTAAPDLGFLATPRTGTGLAHHVGILLPLRRLPILPAGETARRPRVHRPTPRSMHGPVDCSAPGPASPHV